MKKLTIVNNKTRDRKTLWSIDALSWLAKPELGYELLSSEPSVEEKRAMLHKLLAQAKLLEESLGEGETSLPGNSVSVETTVNPEFEALREDARALKLRGYKSMDLDALKKKVADAKKTSTKAGS